jgi:hypothetical protein
MFRSISQWNNTRESASARERESWCAVKAEEPKRHHAAPPPSLPTGSVSLPDNVRRPIFIMRPNGRVPREKTHPCSHVSAGSVIAICFISVSLFVVVTPLFRRACCPPYLLLLMKPRLTPFRLMDRRKQAPVVDFNAVHT